MLENIIRRSGGKLESGNNLSCVVLTESLYGSWFDMVLPYWEYLMGKSNVHFVIYEDLIKV